MSMNVDNALFGRVKVFASLANLKMALGNEGFSDIVIKYMGEQWVMLEFKSTGINENIQKMCLSHVSYFLGYKGTNEFEVDGKDCVGQEIVSEKILKSLTEVRCIGLELMKSKVGPGNSQLKYESEVDNSLDEEGEVNKDESSWTGYGIQNGKEYADLKYSLEHKGGERSVTVSDYFVITRGKWRLTGKNMMIIGVYAPQEGKEKQALWDFLRFEVDKWNGDVIIMGDFNEVHFGKTTNTTASISLDFPNQISHEQSDHMEREVSNDEIKKSVWECGTDKAPGPDGFTFGFFRHFWHLVDRDVILHISFQEWLLRYVPGIDVGGLVNTFAQFYAEIAVDNGDMNKINLEGLIDRIRSSGKKASWVQWKKALAPKDNGGLAHEPTLWSRVIKAILVPMERLIEISGKGAIMLR
ncbi:RNA-directed DNA polymerase, eukaryota, reverse transcriptase zinc-binding domain protein [Tanacetum coccineum]